MNQAKPIAASSSAPIATAAHVDIAGCSYEQGTPDDDLLGKALWVHPDGSTTPLRIQFNAASADQVAEHGAGGYVCISKHPRYGEGSPDLPDNGEVQLFLNERAKVWLHEQLEQNIAIIAIARQQAANAARSAAPKNWRDRLARRLVKGN